MPSISSPLMHDSSKDLYEVVRYLFILGTISCIYNSGYATYLIHDLQVSRFCLVITQIFFTLKPLEKPPVFFFFFAYVVASKSQFTPRIMILIDCVQNCLYLNEFPPPLPNWSNALNSTINPLIKDVEKRGKEVLLNWVHMSCMWS